MLVKIENTMPENQSENLIQRATNLTIDRALLIEARSYKINISRAAEIGIAQAISAAKSAQWKEENRPALQSSNAYALAHGLPLARYRQF